MAGMMNHKKIGELVGNKEGWWVLEFGGKLEILH
jgi:hypothetical protein